MITTVIMSVTQSLTRSLDIVSLLLNNSYLLRVRKIGNSLYMLIPAEIARQYGIHDKCLVKVLILGVEEKIEKDVEEVKE